MSGRIAAAAPPALEARGLGVVLGRSPVLRDVSFTLARGEVVGVLGRNGAGKTTLLRAITRSVAWAHGALWLEGEPLESLAHRQLARRLAVVPQDMHVPFPFSVGELVLMGRAPHQPPLGFESAADVAAARAALERLGIAHLADRSALTLSGGERQLVLIARALVQEPRVLLLDEPTAHLDLHHRVEVLRIVRELARGGCAALVVSHDLGLAARACDRLLLLSGGSVAAAGRPAQVLDPPTVARVFGLDAQVIAGPDGAPLVVPALEAPSG